jgi:hypothetical protein
MDNKKLLIENEQLKQKIETYKEAAEFWMKKHDDLYKSYSENSDQTNARLERISKQIDWLITDYDLAYNTLKSIVFKCTTLEDVLSLPRQLAVACLFQIATNKEGREKESNGDR